MQVTPASFFLKKMRIFMDNHLDNRGGEEYHTYER